MPIYAYRCEQCGFAKDVLQKISDAPLTDCPECGKSAFKKQVTAAGFQLKGNGWYVTDFRGGSGGSGASGTSGESASVPGTSAPAVSGEVKTAAPAAASTTVPAATATSATTAAASTSSGSAETA